MSQIIGVTCEAMTLESAVGHNESTLQRHEDGSGPNRREAVVEESADHHSISERESLRFHRDDVVRSDPQQEVERGRSASRTESKSKRQKQKAKSKSKNED